MGSFRFRLWQSRLSTVAAVQEHPVFLTLAMAVLGIPAAVASALLPQNAAPLARVGLAVAGVVGGILLVLLVILVWAFLTSPRRALEIRMAGAEDTIEGLQGQINNLLVEKYGEPLRFLPVYQLLRTDVREAQRTLIRDRDTGRLWSRAGAPEYGNWKKHGQDIATNPWARIDGIHGELHEAFDHIERLNNVTAMRFGGGRRVRDSDDLDSALRALDTAETMLTGAIDRLEGIS